MPVHLQASHESPFERGIHSCWLVKTVKQVSAVSRTDSMFSPVRCVPGHRQLGICACKQGTILQGCISDLRTQLSRAAVLAQLRSEVNFLSQLHFDDRVRGFIIPMFVSSSLCPFCTLLCDFYYSDLSFGGLCQVTIGLPL